MSRELTLRTSGQGQDLVLLHGWGVNSGVWQAISAALEKHFRVTYIDLPGFGINADVLPQTYDLASITRLVGKCLPQSCAIIGWSLGGLVAQNIAYQHKTKIEQLIIVASSPKFVQSESWPGVMPEVLNTFSQQLKKNFSKTLERFLAIQALGSDTAKSDVKTLKAYIEQYPQPALLALQGGLDILQRADLRQDFARLRMPIHCILGRLDSLVPNSMVRQISELQPNVNIEIFERSSHAPFISQPDKFVATLLVLLGCTTKA